MTMRRIFRLLIVLIVLIAPPLQAAERYVVRPVITVDRDTKNISEPKERADAFLYEFLDSSIYQQLKQAVNVPRTVKKATGDFRAINVNVMDEVPDSSWYTNRILAGHLTAEEVGRGQNVHPRPAFDGEITVTRGKASGISPGFTVKDGKGVTWFLKFDPPENPEMASAAEVIASRIVWAAGYNVPELWIASFRPNQLKIDPKAELNINGKPRKMTREFLDAILQLAARRTDGTYRVIASRLLPGKLKGGFGFYGMRDDDPNDLIPHQHRRDLRGLRVICAWVNHDDIKSSNTVSTYIEEDGRRFLRHYLWDFGSALGSGTLRPNVHRAGHAYILDYEMMGKALVTLGISQPSWSENPVPVAHPSVGRFASSTFEPEEWKPTFHTYAFENMMDSDAYWATRIVAAFTDEHVRAAVRAGELSDAEAETYIVRALIQRRDKIKQRWFTRLTALQDFSVGPVRDGGQEIRFRDLALEHGLTAADRPYTYQFFTTNGRRHNLTPALSVEPRGVIIASREMLATAADRLRSARSDDDRVIHLEVRAGSAKPARAYFVFEGTERGLRLVGLEHRDSS